MESAVERAQREHKRAKMTARSARAKLKSLSQKIIKGAAQRMSGSAGNSKKSLKSEAARSPATVHQECET